MLGTTPNSWFMCTLCSGFVLQGLPIVRKTEVHLASTLLACTSVFDLNYSIPNEVILTEMSSCRRTPIQR